MPVGRLKAIERDISAELAQSQRVVKTEKATARRVNLVVATNLTRRTGGLIVVLIPSQQSAFASLAGISHKRGADAGQPHFLIGLEDRSHHQTFKIKETHIFIAETAENDAVGFPVKHTLRLDRRSETIDCRFIDLNTEDVDRVSLFVKPLHDSHRPAVYRRTEETRDCRVALILK